MKANISGYSAKNRPFLGAIPGIIYLVIKKSRPY
jgi:hypothetical protein